MTGFEIIFQDMGLLMTISVGLIGAGVGAVFPATVALKKDEETKKKIYRRAKFFGWLAVVLGFGGVIYIYASSLEGTPPIPPGDGPGPEIEKPIDPEIDFDKFIELLKNEGHTSKRLTLLNKYSEIIPNQLSVGDLKRILKRFYGNDKRLGVIKVLRNLRKLKKSYTEIERSEIKSMFNNYRWDSEVEKWFDGTQ